MERRDRNLRVGYVYVIEFSTGTVKVGMTSDPKTRFAHFRRESSAYGVSVADTWLSPKHVGVWSTELALIQYCGFRWTPIRDEFFPDADFDAVVAYAKGLTYAPDPSGECEEEAAVGIVIPADQVEVFHRIRL